MRKKSFSVLFFVIILLITAVFVTSKQLKRDELDNTTTTNEQGQPIQLGAKDLLTRSNEMNFNKPFGLHGTYGHFDQVQELGANIVRRHLLWDKFEPTKGDYQLSGISRELAGYQNNPRVEILVDLNAFSKWGGNLQAQAIENKANAGYHVGFPSDIEAWTAMVTYIVEKLDGDDINDLPGLKQPVKYWQVEQEWIWQWKDTPEKYVKFLKITSEAVKKADPEAKIVTGALTSIEITAFADGHITDRDSIDAKGKFGVVSKERILGSSEYKDVTNKIHTLLRDGGSHFDILDFHSFTQDPYVLEGSVSWLQDKLKKSGNVKTIWSTENAGPFGDYSEREHVGQVIKRYMIATEAGVERLFWNTHLPLNGWPENFVKLSLVDRKNSKKPAYNTYKIMADKLNGMRNIRRIEVGDWLYVYEVYNDQERIFVAWIKEGSTTVSLPFDKKIKVTHVWNGKNGTVSDETIEPVDGKISIEISEDPIFIETID